MNFIEDNLNKDLEKAKFKLRLKRNLTILAVVGGLFVAYQQNGFGKNPNYILGLGGAISALAGSVYLKRLRNEIYNKSYILRDKEIILDKNLYSIESSEQIKQLLL